MRGTIINVLCCFFVLAFALPVLAYEDVILSGVPVDLSLLFMIPLCILPERR
jgi:hypothetical protein